MSPLVLCLLLASLASAVPRKDCNLVRSKTDIGQCFKEPECEQKCQTRSETKYDIDGVNRSRNLLFGSGNLTLIRQTDFGFVFGLDNIGLY